MSLVFASALHWDVATQDRLGAQAESRPNLRKSLGHVTNFGQGGRGLDRTSHAAHDWHTVGCARGATPRGVEVGPVRHRPAVSSLLTLRLLLVGSVVSDSV